MDKDGCVPLDVIARFNRVRALTQDVIMIKEVCLTMGGVVCCGSHAFCFVHHCSHCDSARRWRLFMMVSDQRTTGRNGSLVRKDQGGRKIHVVRLKV